MIPSNFPNQMFGGMPDSRFAYNTNIANTAFANPGGFGVGSGMLGGVANMLISSAFGNQPMRPFQGYEGGHFEFLQSMERMRLYRDPESIRNNLRLSPDLAGLGKLGSNPLFQTALDITGLTYGGSAGTASQFMQGRMGTAFGGSLRDQKVLADRAVEQLNTQFSAGGAFSYDRSFGFGLTETASNIASMSRFGMIREDLGKAVKGDRFAQIGSQANELVGLGKRAFGNDMSNDQIGDLLDRAIGGITKVTPEKASEFLAKIQAASRAVDTNAKAFAEYMSMQQNMYKQLGLEGSGSADAIANAALVGKSVSLASQQGGGGSLSDPETARAAAARNNMARQSGSAMNLVRGIGASYHNLSADQKAAIQVDGLSGGLAIAKLQGLIDTGASDQEILGYSARLIGSNKGALGYAYQYAGRMNADIAHASEQEISTNGQIGVAARKKYTADLMGKLSGNDLAVLNRLGKDGSALAGVTRFSSSDNIISELMSKGATRQEAESIASTMSKEAMAIESVKTDMVGFQELIARQSTGARTRTAEAEKKIQREGNVELLLNRRMGAIAKSLDVTDIGHFAAQLVGGLNGKDISLENIKAEAIKAGIVFTPEKVAALSAALSNGDLDKASDAAEEAAAIVKQRGGNKSEQEMARRSVLDSYQGLTADEIQNVDQAARESKADMEKAKLEKPAVDMKPSEGLLEQMVGLLQAIVDAITGGKTTVTPPTAAPSKGDWAAMKYNNL